MSFAEKLKTSQSELLYLVRGKDKGRVAWYYLLVDKMKQPIFTTTMKTKPSIMHLDEYGQIIDSGWGENPPADVVERITAQFGG